MRRNRGHKRSEEQGHHETQRRDYAGEPGAAAGFDPRSGFNVGAGCAGAYERGEAGGDRIDQHGPLDLGQVSALIQKSRPRGNPDECAHGVYECHDENGEHHREESPSQRAVEVEFEEDGRKTWRQAHPGFGWRCNTGGKGQKRSGENSHQDRSRKAPDHKHGNQQKPEDRDQNGHGGQVTGAHWRSRATRGPAGSPAR